MVSHLSHIPNCFAQARPLCFLVKTGGLAFRPTYWYAAGACCSNLGVQHYGMADEIEFLENYKTHVASTVIMMQVQPPFGDSTGACCLQHVTHVAINGHIDCWP